MVLYALALVPGAAEVDYLAKGNDHYFNLEYDEAIEAYKQLLKQRPDDPHVYNHLATSVLYKELHRLGLLETSAFKGDNDFLKREKPDPDPKLKDLFLEYLRAGRALAEERLEKSPKDIQAMLALSQGYGLEGNYEFMVEKSYFSALRNGNRARKFSNKIIKQNPEFVDAYMIAGVHEYVVGSLPWAIRVLIAFGGINGNKEKGEGYVQRVAEQGETLRNEARALMALLHRREKRPLEAAKVLQGMMKDFPRNYVVNLELASMYQDAGEDKRALDAFREIQRKISRNEPGFGRIPGRTRDALARRIEAIEEKLAASPATQTSFGAPGITAR
jgi:predicted Zn-dependent protease